MPSARKMTSWVAQRDGEIGAAYARESRLDQHSDSLGAREILVNTVHAWTARRQGGVVLATMAGQKCLSMEFFAPLKSATGDPCVRIEFVRTTSLPLAERFLAGEDMEVISCTAAIFDKHLAKHSSPKGNLIDVKSGAALYDGIITPLPVEA